MTLEEQQSVWAAEDAAALIIGKAKDAYYAFITKIAKFEERPGQDRLYLTDEGVDHENSEHYEYGSRAYWDAMMASAECAVQDRAESAGINADIFFAKGA